jgi:hypothetical protein
VHDPIGFNVSGGECWDVRQAGGAESGPERSDESASIHVIHVYAFCAFGGPGMSAAQL